MKSIINRRTGNKLTIEEAIALCGKVKAQTGSPWIDHTSVYGYATPELAEKANLRAVCEAHEGYTFAFIGTDNKGLEGYKVRAIGIHKLPSDFEKRFPDFVVIG